MFFRRILRALCLTLFLLMLVACSGSQASSSSPVPPPESGSSAAESSPQPSSEPEPPSPSAAPEEESADAPAEFEPAEAVEASGGTTEPIRPTCPPSLPGKFTGRSAEFPAAAPAPPPNAIRLRPSSLPLSRRMSL